MTYVPFNSRARAVVGERSIRVHTEDQIVTPITARKVLAAVVDDVVRPDSSRDLDVPGAADRRDLGAKRLRELHRERADSAGGAFDQHPLARPQPALLTNRLQRRICRRGGRRGFLEGDIQRFRHHGPFGNACILREAAESAGPEHFVAGPECLDAGADSLDASGDIEPEDWVLRL